MKTDDILAKVKATATQAGQAAVKAADKAAKTAERLVETTKLQYQIYELKGEIDGLYKEVGKLMHAAHRNKPVEDSKLDEMLSEIDRKLEALDELQERKARSKNRKYCRACGNSSEPEAVYCGHCGAPFEAEEKTEVNTDPTEAETEPKTEGTQASE